MRPSDNLKNKTLSDTYRRVQLVCMKVQAHSSLEPPLEYNQDFDESRFVMTFSTILKDPRNHHKKPQKAYGMKKSLIRTLVNADFPVRCPLH